MALADKVLLLLWVVTTHRRKKIIQLIQRERAFSVCIPLLEIHRVPVDQLGRKKTCDERNEIKFK